MTKPLLVLQGRNRHALFASLATQQYAGSTCFKHLVSLESFAGIRLAIHKGNVHGQGIGDKAAFHAHSGTLKRFSE